MIPSRPYDAPDARSADHDSPTARVAFVIQDLGPGGAERVVVDYANALESAAPIVAVLRRKQGFESDLTTGVGMVDLSSGSGDDVDRAGPPGPVPGSNGRLRGLFRLARMARTLSHLVRRRRVDVISTFLTKSHVVGFLAHRWSGRGALVVNVHEQLHEHLTRHFDPASRTVFRYLLRLILPRADRVVVVSEDVRDEVTRDFGVQARRVIVASNPVDRERILNGAAVEAHHPFFDEPTGPVVVAVGRLVHLKGFHILLDAVARLSNDSTRLLVIGDGPEKEALEAQGRRLGLEGRLSLVGHRDNPWSLMSRADLFVLPSLTEALPNVLAEALVLGLPVVATDCSAGVRRYLDDGRAGRLVPIEDPTALSREIDLLLADSPGRAEWARAAAGRARALELDGAVDAYTEILNRVAHS